MKKKINLEDAKLRLAAMKALVSNDATVNVVFTGNDNYANAYCVDGDVIVSTRVSTYAGEDAFKATLEREMEAEKAKRKKELDKKEIDEIKRRVKITTLPVQVEELENFSMNLHDLCSILECSRGVSPRIAKRGKELYFWIGEIKFGAESITWQQLTMLGSNRQRIAHEIEYECKYAEAEEVGIGNIYATACGTPHDAFLFGHALNRMLAQDGNEGSRISVTSDCVYRCSTFGAEIDVDTETTKAKKMRIVSHNLATLTEPFSINGNTARVLSKFVLDYVKGGNGTRGSMAFLAENKLIYCLDDWRIQVPISNEISDRPELNIDIKSGVSSFVIAQKDFKKVIDELGVCKAKRSTEKGKDGKKLVTLDVVIKLLGDRVEICRIGERIKGKARFAMFEIDPENGEALSTVREPVEMNINYDELKYAVSNEYGQHIVGIAEKADGENRLILMDSKKTCTCSLSYREPAAVFEALSTGRNIPNFPPYEPIEAKHSKPEKSEIAS